MENIHEYLATIGSNVKSGKVRVEDFIIFKVRPFVHVFDDTGQCDFTAIGEKSRGLP